MRQTALLCGIVLGACLLSVRSSGASEPVVSDPAASDPELILLYDFQDVTGTEVADGSGHGHTGRLEGGAIVSGRRKPAVQFSGQGMITTELPRDLDLAAHALTVGAMCKPSAGDGVIVSMGDAQDGFSLFLQGGVPHFAVRSDGKLSEVVAGEAVDLDQWVHVAGSVDEKGELRVLVNTWQVTVAEGRPLAHVHREPLTVGADPGSPVAGYAAPLHWQGLLQDVRLYQGGLSREANRSLLGDWAQRPGCSCRK